MDRCKDLKREKQNLVAACLADINIEDSLHEVQALNCFIFIVSGNIKRLRSALRCWDR